MNFLRFCALAVLCGMTAAVSAAAAGTAPPAVVVTLKPIHSLASSVMQGIGKPRLLLEGNVSPHHYQLRPSAAAALAKANLVVLVDESIERYMHEPLENLANMANVLTLSSVPGIQLLPLREQSLHGHGHGHAQHEESHSAAEKQADSSEDDPPPDPHLWLNPDNAAIIIDAIVDALVTLDPANSGVYSQNADAAKAEIQLTVAEIEETLSAVRDGRYFVFHDSFQYFEHRFGMTSAGVISVQPDVQAGAATLKQAQHEIEEREVVCLFSEAQLPSRQLNRLVEDTGIKSAQLDPLGGSIASGPAMYSELLRINAAAFVDCLKP